MPTQHAPFEYRKKIFSTSKILDKRLSAIQKVEIAVGKWGRVNSALDQHHTNVRKTPLIIVLNIFSTRMVTGCVFKMDKEDNYIFPTEQSTISERSIQAVSCRQPDTG